MKKHVQANEKSVTLHPNSLHIINFKKNLEMKKLTVVLVALVAVFTISCKKSPVQEIIDYYTDLTAKIENVDSKEAFDKLNAEAEEFMASHAEALQADVTEAESQELEDVMKKCNEVAQAVADKLGINPESEEATEGEEVAEPAEGEEPAEGAEAEEQPAEESEQ